MDNKLITIDINNLVLHINNIRKDSIYFITSDLIEEKELIEVKLILNKKHNEEIIEILSNSIKVPEDQFLVEYESVIYWLNEYFYEDILDYLQSVKQKNKYIWN